MRLDRKRPGTSTTFKDATSGETILQVASDEAGLLFMAYHLYDANGSFVAQSEGLEHFPRGLEVHGDDGEVLLDIPPDSVGCVQYRLYNGDGRLLTCSDGAKTRIYPLLRMEGVGRLWVPPVAEAKPA